MHRDVVRHLQGAYAIGERRACHAMGFHRSSQRYRSRRDPQTELRVRLRDLAASRVRYGYRRLHVLLRKEGWQGAPRVCAMPLPTRPASSPLGRFSPSRA